MSLLAQIQARSKAGPGSVEIDVPGEPKPWVVHLRYPKAEQQAQLTALIDSFDDSMSGAAALAQNETLGRKMIELCIRTDEPLDDESLTILMRESGGFNGGLVNRCGELLGLYGADRSRIARKGGTKRGR